MELFKRHGSPAAAAGVDEKGKPFAIEMIPCSRCGGSGWINHYRHVEGGICFKCEGQPSRLLVAVRVRLYSAEELAKLNAIAAKKAAKKAEKAAKAAAERAAAEAAARIARAAQVAADPFHQRLLSYAGENEFLANLAEKMRIADLSERAMEAAEEAMARIDEKRRLAAEAGWVGELGERIKFEGVVKSVRLIHQAEGYWDRDRWLVVIEISGGLLKWFGNSPPASEGERVKGSAKIEKHGEFQGIKENLIKNPRWAA
jgi:hypothetical protein